MCLAVPMRILGIKGHEAVCEAGGVERDVNLFLLQGEAVQPGDCVLVHVGYAIKKLSETDMERSWSLLSGLEAGDA